MKQPSKRARKVADLIRQSVALLLKKEVGDPRLDQVSITSVDVSPDLSNAKIYFALPAREKLPDAEKAFASASGYLRSLLAEQLDLRHVPRLQFVFDKSIDHGAKISDLIDQALSSDKQRRSSDAED